jgi:lactate dehydrogenase-like 2-hydroxyacid dehydrogenase
MKTQLTTQGIDDEVFKKLFNNIEGFIILDTVDNSEECLRELEKLNTGVKIIETHKIGVDNVKSVVLEAIKKSQDTLL